MRRSSGRLPLPGGRDVSTRTLLPDGAEALLVFAHGAGAGMEHRGMKSLAVALAGRGIATLRFQFPYMEASRRFPDPPAARLATVGAALRHAATSFPGLTLFAGGRSMGGRMCSEFVAAHPQAPVAGLIFFGFPLHPARKPSTSRADHLQRVGRPMLFLQGTRDALAPAAAIERVCDGLAPHAELHFLDGADHGFRVLKRSGRTEAEIVAEAAEAARAFVERVR